MKKCIAVAALALAVSTPVLAADVGVSVSISQPGVYGRIDIGRFPQPQVVVAQPVLIHPPRVVLARPAEPIYMWVPPGHQKNWGKHCAKYSACGQPVYFVRDEWYEHNVRHEGRGKHPGKGHGKGRGKDRG